MFISGTDPSPSTLALNSQSERGNDVVWKLTDYFFGRPLEIVLSNVFVPLSDLAIRGVENFKLMEERWVGPVILMEMVNQQMPYLASIKSRTGSSAELHE
jgi:hypothetical protein